MDRRVQGCVLGALLLGAVLCAGAEDLTLEVTANRPNIYLGESVMLTVKVPGLTDAPEPDLSAIRNAVVQLRDSRPQNFQQIISVNGRVQRTGFTGRVFTYEIQPAAAGRFEAGPIRLTVDGRTVTAPGPVIQVQGTEAQDRVRVSVRSSRETALVDEPFEITLTILVREPQPGLPAIDPSAPPNLNVPYLDGSAISGLEVPDVRGRLQGLLVQQANRPAFTINGYISHRDPMDMDSFFNMGNPLEEKPARFMFENRPLEDGGRRYTEYRLSFTFTPTDEGTYTFGPALFKGDVVTGVDGQNRKAGQRIFAVGPACVVRVTPPPDDGRPPTFTGTVGRDLKVESSIDTQTCNVGDPLALTVRISGNVNVRNVFPPDLARQTNLTSCFRVYDDTVKTVTRDTGKDYTFTIRPTRAGTIEVPPIEIGYYDTSARTYRVARTAPIPLVVRQVVVVTDRTVINSVTNAADTRADTGADSGRAVAPVDMDPAGAADAPLGLAPWQMALAGIGPAVFALVLAAVHVRPALRRLTARRRERDACAGARRALARAADGGDPAAARHAVWTALRRYLAHRLGVPEAGFTPSDARHLLAQAGYPAALTNALGGLLEECFNASYAGGPANTEKLADACHAALGAIDSIEERRRGAARDGGTRGTAALVALLLTLPASLRAESRPERGFMWDDANAIMASAASPADFLRAAETYRRLAATGVRNGPLFFNLGTALLQAGQHEEAIAAFLRAERYQGSTPEIRRNLTLAMARLSQDPQATLPWYRIPLGWHYGLPFAWRAGIAAAAFCGLWLVLALRAAGWRRSGGALSVALTVLALFGSSAIASWHQERMSADNAPTEEMSLPAADAAARAHR